MILLLIVYYLSSACHVLSSPWHVLRACFTSPGPGPHPEVFPPLPGPIQRHQEAAARHLLQRGGLGDRLTAGWEGLHVAGQGGVGLGRQARRGGK